MGAGLFKFANLCLGQGLDQDFKPSVRELERSHDHGDHAGFVNIFRLRIILGRIFLGDQHQQLVAVHGVIDRFNGAGAADKKRDNHIIKNHHITDSHHGQRFRDLHVLGVFGKIIHACG